jgi:hypothetical protein
MPSRIPRAPGLPFGGGLNLVLAAGAAYFVWEHGQGRHGRHHLLCTVCWLDRANPAPEPAGPAGSAPEASGSAPEASGGPGPAEPPEQA